MAVRQIETDSVEGEIIHCAMLHYERRVLTIIEEFRAEGNRELMEQYSVRLERLQAELRRLYP